MAPAGTKAAIMPDNTTPSTRNGMAWMEIKTKMVNQAPTAGPSTRGRHRSRPTTDVSSVLVPAAVVRGVTVPLWDQYQDKAGVQ